MIIGECPECEGVLRSMPEFLVECKSCHVSTRIPPCLDCGQVCQWNDDEWIDNPLCQEHETAYPCCPCGHTEFQKPAEGAFWRGCLDCGNYYLEKKIELEDVEDEELEEETDDALNEELEKEDSETEEDVEEVTSPVDMKVEAPELTIANENDDVSLSAAKIEFSDFPLCKSLISHLGITFQS